LAWREEFYPQETNALFTDGDFETTFHVGLAVQGLGLSQFPQTIGGHNLGYSIEHFDEDKIDEHDEDIPTFDQKYDIDAVHYSVSSLRQMEKGKH
jgi:hypothetical protein